MDTPDLKSTRRAVESLKKMKIVGEPPTIYWDFEKKEFVDLSQFVPSKL